MPKPRWVAKASLNYEYFTFAAVVKCYTTNMIKVVGFPFNYKYQALDVFCDQNNIDRYREWLLKHSQQIARQIAFIKKQAALLKSASQKYGSQKSLGAFKNWHKVFINFLPSFALVLCLEEALEKMVKMFLSADDFYKISFARETDTAHEQKSLLKIALLPNNNLAYQKDIKQHHKQFAWLGNKFLTRSPLTLAQIEQRVKAIRPRAKITLAELNAERTRLEKSARQVLSKLNRQERGWVNLYQEILYLRTFRANVVSQIAETTLPLFSYLAEKLGYTRNELVRFSPEEIINMFQSGKKLDAAKRAAYNAVCINGKLRVKWGSYGQANKTSSTATSIKGVVACRGRAVGLVKIIYDLPDLKKVKAGDILVASYTNPNMITAMEKAAAFVTNVGGLTSHAAIVAREMNKPCIIDTKIATEIFKDGDKVEVDADKGVVRKIK